MFLAWQSLSSYKDPFKRTESDVLKHKALKISCDLRYHGYEKGLAVMAYNFFDRKSAGSGAIKTKSKSSQQSTDELHNRWIIREFKRPRVCFLR